MNFDQEQKKILFEELINESEYVTINLTKTAYVYILELIQEDIKKLAKRRK